MNVRLNSYMLIWTLKCCHCCSSCDGCSSCDDCGGYQVARKQPT